MNLLKHGCMLAMFSYVMSANAFAFSPEARGTARGGAYSSFADGADGMWWNAAALGFPTLASGMLGFGIEGGNNALSLSRLMGVIGGSDAEKRKAVEDVRKVGAWNATVVAVGGGAATVKGIGIGIFPHASISAKNVSPDAVEFALFYPDIDPTPRNFNYEGEITRSVYTSIGAGYGKEIVGLIPGVSISAGAALNFFVGHDYEYTKTKQSFKIDDPIPLTSSSVYKKATSGKGVGIDLGVHARAFGALNGSVVLKNLGAQIKWTDVNISESKFDPGTSSPPTPPRFDVPTPRKGEEKQKIPTRLLIAVGGSIPVAGTSGGIELEVNTTDSETRAHLGLEQKLFGVLALRGGYVTKAGASPSMVTFGLGLGALVASFDIAAGVALNGKGGSLAASGNINF